MENTLFNNLQVVSGEVKTELITDSVEIEVGFRGEVALTKGNFEQLYNYSFHLCSINQYGYVDCEDWDTDEGSTKLGGLPIDSLSKFKQTLNDSGLSTLAKSLVFNQNEIQMAVFLAIENSKNFKKQYGKNAKNWRVLTDAKQKIVKLNYAIDNYATCRDYDKTQFNIVKLDENENEIYDYIPTIEELRELLDSLID